MDTPKKIDLKIAAYAKAHDMTYMQAKAWLKADDDNGQKDAERDGKSDWNK
jgi:hypothetical protein